jgi:hypothetical protein
MVRGGGLEPPHPCGRQDLNLVRLPISPPAHRKTLKIAAGNHSKPHSKLVSPLF